MKHFRSSCSPCFDQFISNKCDVFGVGDDELGAISVGELFAFIPKALKGETSGGNAVVPVNEGVNLLVERPPIYYPRTVL